MKKKLSLIPFALSCLILIISLVLCIFSIYDINFALDELANDPSVSGIDYMGVGWGYGICLFAFSAFGLILSVISKRLLKQKILQNISIAAALIFVFLSLVSLFLFFI